MALKLSSLVEDDKKVLYYKSLFSKNPEFFRSKQTIEIALQLGLFDFTLDIDPDDLSRYIDGDWTIKKYTNKQGNEVKIGVFETILSGDIWDLYEPSSYDGEWEGALDYHTNADSDTRIRGIINKLIVKKGDDPEDFKDHSLQDLINEFDESDNIINALRSSLGDSESSSYHNYLFKELNDVCSELGEVLQLNDEGVKIKINFTEIIEDSFPDVINNPERFLDYIDGFELSDSSDIYYELMYDGYGEKPKFSTDDRWQPDIDDKEFNEILSDRLDDVESDYGI